MGLFSSKKKTYVSSSIWNMAGDPDDIPRVLPSLVLSSVLLGSGDGIGASVVHNLRSSTFMRSQSFFKWAVDNYDLGIPTATLGADYSVNGRDITPALRTALGVSGSNTEVEVLSARVEELYLGHWAEDWIIRNRPLIDIELQLDDGGWEVSYNVTDELLIINLPGETISLPAPADLIWAHANMNRRLLYVAYRILTKNTSTGLWTTGDNQLFTYRMGSGNSKFDSLKPTAQELLEFAPAIPLWLKNRSMEERPQFDNVKKAFKKLTGGKIMDVIDELADHDDIKDMDHVFVVQGIPLNTKSNSGKAYIYEFLKRLMSIQPVAVNNQTFIINRRDDIIAQNAWERWRRANTEDSGNGTNLPNYNTIPPAALIRSADNDKNELRVVMGDLSEFDLRIQWGTIQEVTRVGNGARFDGPSSSPMMKKGEYRLVSRPNLAFTFYNDQGLKIKMWLASRDYTRTVVLHQYETRRYRMLEVTNLNHINMVYKKKSVDISAKDALQDDELSGFILPLHLPTVKSLSAVHKAEISGHATHLLINSYQVVKRKWYQRGIFKIVLFIAAIAFTFITAGAGGLAAASGLLGTNAAVGAALGATGVMAAVLGAVVNGIAGIVLTTIITEVATTVLGDKWGAILSQVISAIAMRVVHSVSSTGTFAVNWGEFFKIDNLLQITDSVTGTYAAYLHQDTLGLQEAMEDARDEYSERMKEIREHSREILGMTTIAFDATLLTDAAEHFGESRDSFLSRTLLTGSDLAQMSHLLIEGFADISLELPRSP